MANGAMAEEKKLILAQVKDGPAPPPKNRISPKDGTTTKSDIGGITLKQTILLPGNSVTINQEKPAIQSLSIKKSHLQL